jgi:protein gp37
MNTTTTSATPRNTTSMSSPYVLPVTPAGRQIERWRVSSLTSDIALEHPLHWHKPRHVILQFDLFHEDVPDGWIERVFAMMTLAPQHTFQILTKRANRMRDFLTRRDLRLPHQLCGGDGCNYCGDFDGHVPWVGYPMPNVWLGVSAEDQRRADERVPDLLATPAAVRFVSAEPLLGAIDFSPWLNHMVASADLGGYPVWTRGLLPSLDQIITGGESGRNARPMHPDWARSIRDQCAAAHVPFFFKQWGEFALDYDRERDDPDWRRCDLEAQKTPHGQWLNLAGGMGFHGDRVVRMDRVGKKAAGRTLDGRTHDAFPEATR